MQNNNEKPEPIERIALGEVRAEMTDVIQRLLYRRHRIIITRYGKDVAELVPLGTGPLEPSMRERFPEFFAR